VPPDPPRWSAANAAWFTWSHLNWQLWLPLSLLLLAGIVAAVRRFVRERDPADHTPELLAGLAGAYVCLTLLMGLHAPYYALPMLPFEALLATLWLARLRGRPARLAIGALALVGAVNFLAVSVFGLHPVRFTVGPHAPTGRWRGPSPSWATRAG
jgi:hypothetical protein